VLVAAEAYRPVVSKMLSTCYVLDGYSDRCADAISYNRCTVSGVTMGWLLRLVTGGPAGGRGPRQF